MSNIRNTRYQLEAAVIEFDEGGHTIWVQSPEGATMLRIKTMNGKITVDNQCQNSVAHSDIVTTGDIEICIPRK